MSEVTIRWDQRVAGRNIGDVETVEETSFIAACVKQLRCHVVSGPVVAPVVEAPVLSPVATPAPILGVFEDAASVEAEATEKDLLATTLADMAKASEQEVAHPRVTPSD